MCSLWPGRGKPSAGWSAGGVGLILALGLCRAALAGRKERWASLNFSLNFSREQWGVSNVLFPGSW